MLLPLILQFNVTVTVPPTSLQCLLQSDDGKLPLALVLMVTLISCFKEEVWAGVACLVVTAVLVAIVVFVVSAFAVVIAVSVVDMLGDVGFNAVVILVDTAALDIDVVVST